MPDQQTPTENKALPKPKKSSASPVLPSIIALTACVLAGTALWQQHQGSSQLTQQGQVHTRKASQLNDKLEGLQTTLVTLEQQLQNVRQEQHAQERALTQTQAAVRLVKQSDQSDNTRWRLQEVEHLLNLAILNHQFQRDQRQTITILEIADDRLRQLADTHYSEVRKQLRARITNLQAQAGVDHQGLLARLASMSELAYQLPVNSVRPLDTVKVDTAEVSADASAPKRSWWRQGLQQSAQTLKKIVVVRRVDTNTASIIGPAQHELAIRTIVLQLQQAQWAVVSGDQALYAASIKQALATLANNFDPNHATSKTLAEQLSQLQEQTIAATSKASNLQALLQLLQEKIANSQG